MKKSKGEIKISKGPIEQSFSTDAAMERKPIKLQHDGICHKKVVNLLMEHEEAVLGKMSPKIRDNGFLSVNNNGNGHIIEPIEDCWAAAFIPGVALASSEMDGDYAACAIVNTLNEGFVYATVNEKNEMEAIGPVVTPCIIGNSQKPHGIYIPMNNRTALETGIGVALDYLNAINGISDASVDGTLAEKIEDADRMIESNRKCNW